MKCTYCGAEVAEHHQFCISCGTKVQKPVPLQETVTQREPAPQLEPVAWHQVWDGVWNDATTDGNKNNSVQPQPAEKPQEHRVVVDPEKFEFYPEQRDEPVSRGVSSWELVPAEYAAPALKLPTKRGLGKMFFLGLITAGIYPMTIYSKIVTELNILASRYDGQRTMTFFGMLMVAPFTLGIYALIWFHQLCDRIGNELQRRGINYKFGPSHFWLWNVLGACILVGPFVFLHKLMKSMNLLNKDFNEKG